MKLESLGGAVIFALTFVIFLISCVHVLADSDYSMLLSQSLLDRGSFRLDAYALPRYGPTWQGYYFSNGPIYQLEVSRGHLYYHLPPGSSVLSIPFVAALNRRGISAANSDGTYNSLSALKIETIVAALLMAGLASLFFYTARLLLPIWWSVVVALGGALGTQVYSTASRALWSHTWAILLLGIVVFLLLKAQVQKRRLSPVLLATLLSWTYFVRPTFAAQIFAISFYVLIFQRPIFLRYAFTGAMWLAGFVFYSWCYFGQLLPNYYRAGRLQSGLFRTALAGNLISPARGLFVYVPALFFVCYLLVRYKRRLAHRKLVWLAATIVTGHLVVISGFPHWWAGHSYGPRLTTDLVPWFVLLAILGLRAALDWRGESAMGSLVGWRVQLSIGATLLLLSVLINMLGATSRAAASWNVSPQNIDEHPERLWDWRQPQFLAGYLAIPPPREFPPLGISRIAFSSSESAKYLWEGWSVPEPDARWSDGHRAVVVFALGPVRTTVLRIDMMPFLVPGRLDEQRVGVTLNGHRLPSLTLREPGYQVRSIKLPGELLRENNVLSFEIPGATSPQSLGAGADERHLGIKVRWIEMRWSEMEPPTTETDGK